MSQVQSKFVKMKSPQTVHLLQMFSSIINLFSSLCIPQGVWLPQHVCVGGQRLVCVQGDPLALPEILLSGWTFKASGPCTHLTIRKATTRLPTEKSTCSRHTEGKEPHIYTHTPHVHDDIFTHIYKK